jgi:hypothetical protein
MTRALMAATFALLLAACDSPMTTAPTTVTPPLPNNPTPPFVTPGPGPVPGAAPAVAIGESIEVTVEDGDARCYPNWDATGRCRHFAVTVSADGTLVAGVTAAGPNRGIWNPDVFVTTRDGLVFYPDFGWPTNHASGPVVAGFTYLVAVMSYGPFPDVLKLTIELSR